MVTVLDISEIRVPQRGPSDRRSGPVLVDTSAMGSLGSVCDEGAMAQYTVFMGSVRLSASSEVEVAVAAVQDDRGGVRVATPSDEGLRRCLAGLISIGSAKAVSIWERLYGPLLRLAPPGRGEGREGGAGRAGGGSAAAGGIGAHRSPAEESENDPR